MKKPEPELQTQALTLAQQASAIVIHDQHTYDHACEFGRAIKAMQEKAEAHHRPVIKAAHASHQAALAALASIANPLKAAEKIVKQAIGDFLAWQEEQRREAEAQAAAELQRAQLDQIRQEREATLAAQAAAEEINAAAIRKAEEARYAAAALAEVQGATVEEVRAILDEPLRVALVEPAPVYVEQPRYVPPPRMGPSIELDPDIRARENWSGEVTDIKALCAAIGRGEAHPNLVKPNETAINFLARMERRVGLSVPGLRGVCSTNVAIGGV